MHGYRELNSSPLQEQQVLSSSEMPLQYRIANDSAKAKSMEMFLSPETLKVPPRSTMASVRWDLKTLD